jgi:curved DNA-binding protein
MSNGAGDYYAVLGVARSASADDIQAAYRKLARKHHPDVNKDAASAETFKKVTEAYEVLKDPKKRELYDRYGANWKAAEQAGVSPGGARRGGPGGHAHAGEHVGGPEEFYGFGDIFDSVFGGAGGGGGRSGGRRRPRSRPGRDVESEIEVSLSDVVHGGTRHVALTGGAEGGEDRRELSVKVPPGTTDGSVIRLSGQGEPGVGGGAPGDLLLRVRVAPDPRFTLDGHDLITVVPVSPWEAALGAKVPAPTPDGEVVVTVPPGTSSGQKLRLRGKGLPTRGGGAGDVFVELRIVVPRSLSEKERELLESLRDTSNFDPRRT